MVVIRSMEVTQKKTTMTFKQSDGVLRTIDEHTGDRVSLSHKCSELDRILPPMLGLSKAVIESVIFCHQEEASWPLQEGAVLKKQFDAIFDSARYTKALDNFRKTKKDLANEAKELKVEVSALASHQHAAKGFKEEEAKHDELQEEIDKEIKKLESKIAKSLQDLTHWSGICDRITSLQGQISEKETKLETIKQVRKSKRGMLEEDLTKQFDAPQLRERLRDFDKDVQQQQERFDALSRDYQKIQDDIEALRQEEMDLNKSKGKYAAEKDAHDKRLTQRVSKMESILTSYSVDILSTGMSQQSKADMSMMGGGSNSQASLLSGISTKAIPPEQMREFFRGLEKKEDELRESLREHKAKIRAQEEEIQTALTDYMGKKNAMENGM